MMGFLKTNILAISVAVLAACTPHTFLESAKPSTPIPQNFPGLSDQNVPSELQRPWWENFERETLDALIDEALANNQSVAQAIASLNQARALTRETSADRLPQIDGEGDLARRWRGSEKQDITRALGAALSWEIDLFDRIGAAAKADRFEALARAEDVEAVKLSLSADVANAYFGAAASHRGLALLKEQLYLDRKLKNLLELRLKNGVGTSVDVLRQEARVADSQTLIPLVEAELAVFENRLDVLLGQVPDGEFRVPEKESLNFAKNLPPVGVPASLLLNRPDLRVMQAELFAADADIAAAIAERLPQVTLDASYGYSDTAAFSGPLSMIMGAFVQPLLDWGKRKAAVERNKALYEEKLAEFTQSYLEAFEDVENALVREDKQREFLKRLRKQRVTLQKTVDVSEDRYTEGVDDYLPVIDALQELRQVQRDEITEQLELVNIRINLHRALGGPIKISENPQGEVQ